MRTAKAMVGSPAEPAHRGLPPKRRQALPAAGVRRRRVRREKGGSGHFHRPGLRGPDRLRGLLRRTGTSLYDATGMQDIIKVVAAP